MVAKKVDQCGHTLITELWYANVFTSTTASFLYNYVEVTDEWCHHIWVVLKELSITIIIISSVNDVIPRLEKVRNSYMGQRHGGTKHSCIHVCALHKTHIQLAQEALYLYVCLLALSQSGLSPSLPEKEHLL